MCDNLTISFITLLWFRPVAHSYTKSGNSKYIILQVTLVIGRIEVDVSGLILTMGFNGYITSFLYYSFGFIKLLRCL